MCPRGLLSLKKALSNLKCRNPTMPFYAVARGREVGVFTSWSTCQEMTSNYRGAKFKKFEDKERAWDFVKQFRIKSFDPSCEKSEFAELAEEVPKAKQIKVENEKPIQKSKKDASNSSFDFAAFNLRLTNLENSYQEKIRSLEERLRALEDEKGVDNGDNEGNLKVEDDKSDDSSPKPNSSSQSAVKRKLLDSVNEIFKPGSSRSYSTTALKRIKPSEDESSDSHSKSSTSAVPFRIDPEGFVVVYTDGACSRNGCRGKNVKAGIGVWFNDGHPLNVSAPVNGRAANNVAEIQAATVAVETAAGAGITKLCITTDSQFTINCMTKWIYSWRKKGWKTAKGEPVINKEEVIALDKAIKLLQAVKWVHVKGHDGIHGNEQADMLARNGALSYEVAFCPDDVEEYEDSDDDEFYHPDYL